jgi:hypothetical protein
MTHVFENKNKWNDLSAEEKLDALHDSIGKLFSIVEDLSHKHHVLIDAINLVNSRLDAQAKIIGRHAPHMEPAG